MPGEVVLRGLRKAFGEVVAVRDVSLEVRPGEFLTLLGPSGCGKTTLLRLLAGFESPDAGQVLISGRDVTALPPHRRPVNTVFQHYALFPHLTVAGNLAFGLEMRRRGRAEIAERVAKALEMVRLGGLGERRPAQLSGGQQQRVALARALVLAPEVLLLDEPMAALDLKLRQEMRVEVKNLQERLGVTFVFVTHDQDEALVMSDRIAVMNQGRIEQVGPPEQLYERPRTRFVADFLAVRNLLQATVVSIDGGRAQLRTRGGAAFSAADDGGYRPGEMVWVGVRPERIRLEEGGDNASPPQLSGENRLAGKLEDKIYLGDRTDWRVRVGDETLTVAEPAGPARVRSGGQSVTVSFPGEAVLRLDSEGSEPP